MECIIAYLLLALFVDLIVELVRLDDGEEEAVWIKRRLWTNAPFDCGTRVVAGMATISRHHVELGLSRRNYTTNSKKLYTVSTSSAKHHMGRKGDIHTEPLASYAVM